MEYEWKMAVPSEEDLKDYPSGNALMAATLYNRGIPLDKARDIVADPYKGIIAPLGIINRVAATDLIKKFIDDPKGEIYIFADYDADGITSAAIVTQCLNSFHTALYPNTEWNVYCHVPEREDGYGISEAWCHKIAEYAEKNQNAEHILVVTVDNGITKKNAVSVLLEHNIQVLVTDHHMPDYANNMTPDCVCVDPYIDDRRVGIFLAGCGVIFNLMRLFEDRFLGQDHTITDEYEYLVAIGTIGDMMKMDYYHGCIVTWALRRINSDKCPEWLREVLACLNISHVNSKTIAFSIAAFLNACGQAGQANLALDLVLEPDAYKREAYIQEAFKLYNAVRKITKEEKERAEEKIKSDGLDQHSVIIYPVKTDYPGIVGKIAYHISELTNKPAICYNDKGEATIKGSSRNANDTIPFYDLLKEAQSKQLIISANGHASAQGCEFKPEQIQPLIKFIDEAISRLVRTGKSTFQFKKQLQIDQIISPDDITIKNVCAIESFPFSNNWKEPVLCIMDADILDVHSSRNNEKNVCYTVQSPSGKPVELWTWNIRPWSYQADKHTRISLIGTLSRDFRNERKPMFNVTDFKLA